MFPWLSWLWGMSSSVPAPVPPAPLIEGPAPTLRVDFYLADDGQLDVKTEGICDDTQVLWHMAQGLRGFAEYLETLGRDRGRAN